MQHRVTQLVEIKPKTRTVKQLLINKKQMMYLYHKVNQLNKIHHQKQIKMIKKYLLMN